MTYFSARACIAAGSAVLLVRGKVAADASTIGLTCGADAAAAVTYFSARACIAAGSAVLLVRGKVGTGTIAAHIVCAAGYTAGTAVKGIGG
ncbi:MAG: hypothetical protein ABI563_07045 [Specibacter sp.]